MIAISRRSLPRLPADGGGGSALVSRGTSQSTTASASNDRPPLYSHSACQPCPVADSCETSTADTAIPQPTPAKWTAEGPGRPAAASRSSTRVEAKTRTNALATPATKRSPRNTGYDVVRPIAPVESALTASAARNQWRLLPGSFADVEARAPIRYPAKFADAITPACDLVSPRPDSMNGRIGV